MKWAYLHLGVKWIWRYQKYSFYAFFFGVSLFIALVILLQVESVSDFSRVAGIVFGYLIFVAILIEIYIFIAYRRYRYSFEKDSFNIESGVVWKKAVSIPYWKIQNVDISRGVIARSFGFSTINVQTAGRSGYLSEGLLPAIEFGQAEKIREFLVKKSKK